MHRCITGRWPNRLLRDASRRSALSLAAAVRRSFFGTETLRPIADLREVAAAGGFDVRVAALGGEQGGTEGLLIPRDDGGFTVAVDPAPPGGWGTTPAGVREKLEEHRTRFRIAHELGHSFFYDRSTGRPVREVSVGRGAEEEFCDEFARALLVPPAAAASVPATAASVVRLHRRYDVSVEVAARSLAAHHPERPAVAVYYWEQAAPSVPILQWGKFPRGIRERHLRGVARAASTDPDHPQTPGVSDQVLGRRRQVVVVARSAQPFAKTAA